MEDSAQWRWSGAVRGAIRDIAAKQEDDNEAEAVASEARRPWRRGVEPHWRGSNFQRRAGIFGGCVIAGGDVFGFAILGGVVRLLLTGVR